MGEVLREGIGGRRGAREEPVVEFPTTVVIIFVNRAGALSFETVRAG